MTEAFTTAYETLLRRWPPGTRSHDIPTPYGTTRTHTCGPRHAPPLLLIPGGGATSMVWSALADALATTHRVHALDLIGDAGHSTAQGRPMKTPQDAMNWLDAVLDGLDTPPDSPVSLCGHSYGAWLALTYTLHAPHRVDRLTLLDPTDCLTGMRPAYLLHALPALLRPSPSRIRGFLRWEIAGLPVDEDWMRLAELTADLPRPHIVRPRRPRPQALRNLTTPTLLLLAEHSRTHDAHRLLNTARTALPTARTALIPGASHHSLPTGAPHPISEHLTGFLTGN